MYSVLEFIFILLISWTSPSVSLVVDEPGYLPEKPQTTTEPPKQCTYHILPSDVIERLLSTTNATLVHLKTLCSGDQSLPVTSTECNISSHNDSPCSDLSLKLTLLLEKVEKEQVRLDKEFLTLKETLKVNHEACQNCSHQPIPECPLNSTEVIGMLTAVLDLQQNIQDVILNFNTTVTQPKPEQSFNVTEFLSVLLQLQQDVTILLEDKNTKQLLLTIQEYIQNMHQEIKILQQDIRILQQENKVLLNYTKTLYLYVTTSTTTTTTNLPPVVVFPDPDPQNCSHSDTRPRECSDIAKQGKSESGIYHIYPNRCGRGSGVKVWCDFGVENDNRTQNQGWTVVLSRKPVPEQVNFNRGWQDYKMGFGDPETEFWIGNIALHYITSRERHMLRVELVDWDGNNRTVEYGTFIVESEESKFKMHLSGFSGNAGDAFSYHNHMGFTTLDNDNDMHEGNCAQLFGGGFWFNRCHQVSATCPLLTKQKSTKGINWSTWYTDRTTLREVYFKVKEHPCI